jgi:DNA-binding beta-propeller fold protein YncE
MNTTATTATVSSYVAADTVVTMSGTEYYVAENYRNRLTLIRLRDMKEGFSANVLTHKVKPGREATAAERDAVSKARLAKFEAESKFRVGALVKTVKASKHADPNKVYVIIKESPKTVSIIELGGNAQGAYMTAPRHLLTVIDPADVLK